MSQWYYKSDLRKKGEKDEAWEPYSEAESKTLENAYQKEKVSVKLNAKYMVDIKQMFQYRANDTNKQRPVKREVAEGDDLKRAESVMQDDPKDEDFEPGAKKGKKGTGKSKGKAKSAGKAKAKSKSKAKAKAKGGKGKKAAASADDEANDVEMEDGNKTDEEEPEAKKEEKAPESPSTAPTQAYDGPDSLALGESKKSASRSSSDLKKKLKEMEEEMERIKSAHANDIAKRDKMTEAAAGEIENLGKELKKANKAIETREQELADVQEQVKDLNGQLKAASKRSEQLEKKTHLAARALSSATKAIKGEEAGSDDNSNNNSSSGLKRTASKGRKRKAPEDADGDADATQPASGEDGKGSHAGGSQSATQALGDDDANAATLPMSFSLEDTPSRSSSSGLKRQRTSSRGNLRS